MSNPRPVVGGEVQIFAAGGLGRSPVGTADHGAVGHVEGGKWLCGPFDTDLSLLTRVEDCIALGDHNPIETIARALGVAGRIVTGYVLNTENCYREPLARLWTNRRRGQRSCVVPTAQDNCDHKWRICSGCEWAT